MKPAWWTVFSRELRDLWIGGKALHLILLYTVLLGIYAFFLASNAEVNLLPVKEMILEVVKTAIAASLLLSMIIAADSITAERERATLEGLLLTPASRRQIVLGKFFTAISPIPVALVLTVPYLAVLSKGDPVFVPAMLWLFALGSLLVPALAAMGMLASLWCNTTKISMAVTFMLYLLMLLPAEIIRPGKVMTAAEMRKALVFQSINPIDAITKFLGRVLVYNAPPGDHWLLLSTPVVIGVVALVLVFAVAGPRLRLEAATGRKFRALWSRLTRPAGSRVARPQAARSTSTRGPDAGPPPEVFPLPTAPASPAAGTRRASAGTFAPSSSAPATWWLVFKRELRDLWIGGKALNFTVAYIVLLGGYAYWEAHDSAVSLIPPKEMAFELWKVAMMGAVFMGLILGADTLSGERERATLEGLLLTPTSRLQIVVGKFLAAVSMWPATLIVTVPYTYVLAQGDEVFGQGAMWVAVVGSVVAPAFTALGMFVSFWCNNNKSSMFVSLSLYLIFLLPTQLQGRAQGGFMGLFLQALNPIQGTRHFLAGILINNRTVAEYSHFLVSAVVFLLVMLVLLFWYAGPAVRLEVGRRGRRPRGRAVAAALIACLLGLISPAPSWALQANPSQAEAPLLMSIDKSDTVFRAGTPLLFTTVVRNRAAEESRPIIVAMNIINLNQHGEVVDPEDWSPQRTQYVEPLAPGQSATLDWRVNAILDGDFMVYMVAIPAPGNPDATSQPVASSGIHLTVTPYTKLNPGGVLPYAIGGPVVLGLVILLVYRQRRKQIDAGGST
jgi:ABC-type transport system involved in multi-copper enzyme maturation permease subunit